LENQNVFCSYFVLVITKPEYEAMCIVCVYYCTVYLLIFRVPDFVYNLLPSEIIYAQELGLHDNII